MSFEVGKKALDFLVANSGSRRNLEVDFFGGEPTMNFEVVKQLVEYGRSLEEEHIRSSDLHLQQMVSFLMMRYLTLPIKRWAI